MYAIKIIHRLLAAVLFLVLFVPAAAQQAVRIKGTVADSLERLPVDSALVILKAGKDQRRTLTGFRGEFSFSTATAGDSAVIYIERQGFHPLRKLILLKDTTLDLGMLVLSPLSKMLEDIVIRSRVPPISVRNDTTEYLIDSFDRKKGAMIGDVLKSLPGIEVDGEGNISHNGKPVTRILVNGEEFFGGDKDIALRYLPAELVSRLQVMDTRTREQIFNGLQADGEEKTINIKIKPGPQAFGTGTAGAGTSGQLDARLMANTITEDRHLGLIASARQNNRPGMDRDASLTSSSLSGGLHYREKISGHTKLNGSTSYNKARTMQESRRQLQQFFNADSSFTTDSYNFSDYQSDHYQGNLTLDFVPSSDLDLNLSLLYSGGRTESVYQATTSIMEEGELKGESQRKGFTQGRTNNIGTSLHLNKRFAKSGRTLSVNLRAGYSGNESHHHNNADNLFYEGGLHDKNEMLRQQIISRGNERSAGISFSYMEPLSKGLRLQVTQKFEFSGSENRRIAYNVDSVNTENLYDSAYSNRWVSENMVSTSGLGLVYENDRLFLTAGMQLLQNISEREMEEGSPISMKQRNYSPGVVANYKLSKTKTLRFNFSSSFQNPSIEQLQPVPDNTNPLYIRLGNPDLKPAFQQQYNISYNSGYRRGNMASFSIGFLPVINSIVNAVYFDSYRRRISQYINVDGIYSLRSHWNISKVFNQAKAGSSIGFSGAAVYGRHVFFDNSTLLPTRNYHVRQTLSYSSILMQPRRKSRFGASMTFFYNRTLSPGNTSGINSRTLGLTPKLELSHRIKSAVDLTVFYQASYNRLNYHVGENQELDYTDHMLGGQMEAELGERFSLSGNFNYQHNGRLPAGSAGREIWLINLSASLRMLKNQRGLIRFSAFDLLNSQAEVKRMVGENYIEDVQTAGQRNYFSLSFQYNWTRPAKKKAT